MPLVMLRKDWPGNFRAERLQKQKKGPPKSMGTRDFQPGVPVKLTPVEVTELEDDIGKALLPVELNGETGQITIVDPSAVDMEATTIPDATSAETKQEKPTEGA